MRLQNKACSCCAAVRLSWAKTAQGNMPLHTEEVVIGLTLYNQASAIYICAISIKLLQLQSRRNMTNTLKR
jgi:hypothetical protein